MEKIKTISIHDLYIVPEDNHNVDCGKFYLCKRLAKDTYCVIDSKINYKDGVQVSRSKDIYLDTNKVIKSADWGHGDPISVSAVICGTHAAAHTARFKDLEVSDTFIYYILRELYDGDILPENVKDVIFNWDNRNKYATENLNRTLTDCLILDYMDKMKSNNMQSGSEMGGEQ